ncbi:conserved hypothetical protein [Xenorhabdus nematophila F1]|uniref:Uncharacterized protein n=1 Tax=Xenorhabdus nematophila (strain ATCC 19061 / DSM 3370 / CCUG 14189 / LMG 1036 / NCIMB 9965 / AN6) TaxID=406817 RepID=D3VH98_XENNA|nr:hypothetical protein XNC1_2484 [Xenorhabdus nematophila ATCC 19061]CCW32582.1 conserved hypothetical protein [Xenorhabdus nematophila F1]
MTNERTHNERNSYFLFHPLHINNHSGLLLVNLPHYNHN